MMLAQKSCVACSDLRTNQHLKKTSLLAFVEKRLKLQKYNNNIITYLSVLFESVFYRQSNERFSFIEYCEISIIYSGVNGHK